MSYSCFHFWSHPDTSGHIECLWCGKRIEAPLQYPTSTTAPTQPVGAEGRKPTGKDGLQVGASVGLWCLHVQGPDDVHAAPSREAAELVAGQINAHFATTDVKPNAVAALWPHSPESHAESLKEWEQVWATPPDGAKGEW